MKSFFKKGQIVLFQGDSITDCLRNREDKSSLGEGYASMVASVYNTLFPANGVVFINRGIAGNTVPDLIGRYEEDFLDVKPDFISILVGINDAYGIHGEQNPVMTDADFYERYRNLLDRIRRDMPDTKIMLMEPFLLDTMPEKKAFRGYLHPVIGMVRELARGYADYYLPLDGMFASLCTKTYSPADLSLDSVHPTGTGHAAIAEAYLKSLEIL